jgi:hypothetical protein
MKIEAERGAKPQVARVVLPDGTVRYLGLAAAARWLGCSYGGLAMAVRGIPHRGERLRQRAREEFPGLFEGGE